MDAILSWMEQSFIGQMMRDSSWLFPGAEILHFFGLCLLIGSLMVVDLRLLGVIRDMSYQSIYRFLPISLIGFGINLLTGVLFCFTDPFRYYPNIAFRVKMLLIVLAGLNAFWFKLKIHPLTLNNPGQADASNTAKLVAALSLLLWIGVIVMGRMIPYLEE